MGMRVCVSERARVCGCVHECVRERAGLRAMPASKCRSKGLCVCPPFSPPQGLSGLKAVVSGLKIVV